MLLHCRNPSFVGILLFFDDGSDLNEFVILPIFCIILFLHNLLHSHFLRVLQLFLYLRLLPFYGGGFA